MLVHVFELLELFWREEVTLFTLLYCNCIVMIRRKAKMCQCTNNKGDPIEYTNYRGIKFLDHMMKVMDKVLDQKLRELIR